MRGWEPEDAPAVTAACQDPEIPRYTRVPEPYRLEDAEAFIAMACGHDAIALAVVDAGTGELLGSVALHDIDRERGLAQLGYWVAAHARGRGIASRAARLTGDWAFGHLGVTRIGLHAEVGNVASHRVARRAGFQKVEGPPQPMELKGVVRSVVRYERTKADRGSPFLSA